MSYLSAKNGKRLDPKLYAVNMATRTFVTNENNITINTPHSTDWTYITGDNCKFVTGDNCKFITGKNCTFKTRNKCSFVTKSNCHFETGGLSIFKTEHGCTFKTGTQCTFDTQHGCAFETGIYCTFNVEYDCIICAGPASIIVRKDIHRIIEVDGLKQIRTHEQYVDGYTDSPIIIAI